LNKGAKLEKTILGKPAPLPGVTDEYVPVLIVLRGTQIGRRYLLNETSLVLGRRAGRADIVIEGDPEVSGMHARIYRDFQSNGFTILDLDSLNGTQVNGLPITESPLQDGDKIFIGQTILKFTFHDAIEESYHGHVHKLMNIDDLTGLPVLRAFQDRFRLKLKEIAATQSTLSVLMMDMDGLKKINDTHGHQYGAYAISQTGQMIGLTVGEKGEASRFGGDEFVVYLCHADKPAAMELAENIRLKVGEYNYCLENIQLRPSISIGVASFPEDGRSVESLIRKADEALYRAKEGGRNRVSL
jgi:two-component system, cell cycle response regulator